MVNGRTPLEWFIDRYQIKRDKESGILNDPNGWFEDPRDLVTAIERIVYVSVESTRIIEGLPSQLTDNRENRLCKGYKDRKVSIKIRNYKQPETYECRTTLCDVKTYQATNPCQNLKPYFWYKQHVLVGAIEQNLPPWYIHRLIQVKAKKDTRPKDVKRELNIYS